jgi:hypothetical protein
LIDMIKREPSSPDDIRLSLSDEIDKETTLEEWT